MLFKSRPNHRLTSPTHRDLAPIESLEERTLLSAVPASILAVGADAGTTPIVNVYDAEDGSFVRSIVATDQTFRGGVRVATGDINGDGVADIITALGAGGRPEVKVFDGTTGAQIMRIMAFGTGFNTGVQVATGDVNGDGFDDIIVGAGPGRAPLVKVFSGQSGRLMDSFHGMNPNFRGGVNVATGDINGDGYSDVITSAGAGGLPTVNIINGRDGRLIDSFNAFDAAFTGGVNVAAGDINSDGYDDLVVAPASNASPLISIYDGSNGLFVTSFLAFESAFRGGVRIAVNDINQDGYADIIAGRGTGGTPFVSIFDGFDGSFLGSLQPFQIGFTGGVFPSSHNNSLNEAPINTIPGTQSVNENEVLLFRGVRGNGIAISDPDVGGSELVVTLTATQGNLTLGSTSGLTFLTGDGTSDTTMSFKGSLSDVNAALDGLSYRPDANYVGAATITLTSDDQGFSGSGSALSDTDTININVLLVNDAPTISVPAGPTVHTAGTGSQVIGSGSTVSDPDSANFAGGQLRVTISSGGRTSDTVGIRSQGTGAGQLSLAGTTILYEGRSVGTFSGGFSPAHPLVILFNGNATSQVAQAILNNLTFQSTRTAVGGERTIQVLMTDGDGGTSNVVTTTVQVVASSGGSSTGVAPTVNLGSTSINYRAGATPIRIDSTATVTDPDSTTFNGGKLQITSTNRPLSGDLISIQNNGTGSNRVSVISGTVRFGGVEVGTVTGGIGSDPLTIVFNANSSPQAAQAIMRSIAFRNFGTTTTNSTRTIEFALTDNTARTTTVTKTIRVLA